MSDLCSLVPLTVRKPDPSHQGLRNTIAGLSDLEPSVEPPFQAFHLGRPERLQISPLLGIQDPDACVNANEFQAYTDY